jgi:ribosomal protein S18 acetylase RimI-like enzyme
MADRKNTSERHKESGLSVAPARSGQGWRGRVVEAALQRGMHGNRTSATLLVRRENFRARRLAESMGFRFAGFERGASAADPVMMTFVRK